MISKLLPYEEGLGEIVIKETDEDGWIEIYRPAEKYWSEKEQARYEEENEGTYFGWCVYGANPIFGVSTWILEDKLKEK